MAVHQGFPWLFDPREQWHDRMRRRFAGLPDPPIPVARVPRHLFPLWQFVDVADDLALYIRRSRGGAGAARERDSVALRAGVFMALCIRGDLERQLPYDPAVREPDYVPDVQRGSEAQFI
jgi:hypothetical protein